MKRTHTPSLALVGESVRRLWTGENETRSLLLKGEGSLDGVMLQQARVAESIEKVGGEDSRVIRFRISAETQDRHGDIVRSKGILLKNFRKNPVVLFAHDSRQPPIGKSPKIRIGDRVVDADADFFDIETYEFADTIFRIINKGGLRATSIGFMPIKYVRLEADDPENVSSAPYAYDFKRTDLLEFSIVPVPANPDAVRSVAKSGALMTPYKDWLEDMQDNWDHTGEFMKDLGLSESDFTACRDALGGDPTTIVMPKDWGDDEGDTLNELQILDINEDDEGKGETVAPIMLRSDDHEYPDGGDVQIVELQGVFPQLSSFAADLVDAGGADGYIGREDELITLRLDNATADYKIESEEDGIIIGSLVQCTYSESLSWHDTHAEGTAKQARTAKWNGSREEKAADSAVDLPFMAAWSKQVEEGDSVPDFRFLHHAAGTAEEPYPVNFRALVTCMAKLLGADGGTDILNADRKGVWNHLARHFRDDFGIVPPELRWVELQPLKEFTDTFFFDYSTVKLLVRNSTVTDEEGAPPTFIESREVTVSEKGEFIFPEAPVTQLSVHTLSSRRRKWDGLEKFVAWAKDEGFEASENVSTSRHFWRMRQLKDAVSDDAVVISLYPNDVDAASPDCIVSASLVPVEEEGEQTEKKAPVVSSTPSNFALAADGSVQVHIDEAGLIPSEYAKHVWALMVSGDPLQVIGLKAVTAEEADTAAREIVKSLGSVIYLGRFAGAQDDGSAVYADYALYRLKDGMVTRKALDDEAVDEVQEFVECMERLSAIVSDFSENELAQLAPVKEWLDEVFASEDTSEDDSDDDSGLADELGLDNDEPGDQEDGLESLFVASLEDGELSDDICEAVKEVVLDLAEESVKDVTDAAKRKEVGLVD